MQDEDTTQPNNDSMERNVKFGESIGIGREPANAAPTNVGAAPASGSGSTPVADAGSTGGSASTGDGGATGGAASQNQSSGM